MAWELKPLDVDLGNVAVSRIDFCRMMHCKGRIRITGRVFQDSPILRLDTVVARLAALLDEATNPSYWGVDNERE